MQVDGERNSVYEVDAAALPPGPDNPYGNAWVTKKTLLSRESEAQRLIDPLVARTWYITNPSSINELGQPTCYKLMPGDNVLPLQQEGSQAFARAQFAYKHLWVTAFDPGELYAAGNYPNQHGSPGGLVEYQKADRLLENEDLVVWYSFGAHHVVRPEDWPVMPVSYVGFMLKPVGFFDGNPALDMPRSPAACHTGDGHGDGHANGHAGPDEGEQVSQ
jgi:primary-amine oxidase